MLKLTADSDLKPWYSIALAVQALCINDVGIQDSDIQKILSSQNTGGSFGQSAGVGKILVFIESYVR